jgi:hypothetical protein
VKLLRLLFLITSIILSHAVNLKANKDSLSLKNSFKLDLMSVYYDFFDNRVQIRAGFDFERKINLKSFISYHLDIGIYDKYIFRKYYDFFNQNKGMYSIEQNVVIKGFHFIPGYYCYILQSKRKPSQGLFLGGNADLNFYRKKLKSNNSQTSESFTQRYNQSKLALGLSLGYKYKIYHHFFVELQTSMFATVFKKLSDEKMNPIKPLIAQWNDQNYNYWWMSEIKICYAL